MLNYLAWASTGLYAADIAVHLTAVAQKKERLRRISKVLLMPLAALTFSLWWFSISDAALPVLVVAGLLMGCLGDTLLLNHHHKIGLPVGLASFSAGHVLYIVQIWRISAPPAWWVFVLLVLVYGAGVACLYVRLFPYLPKAFRVPSLAYMLLISSLSVSAAAAALKSFTPGAALVLAGTLLFMLSDGILSFEVFRTETHASHLKVMVPYIAAQTLISAGFLVCMA